MWSFVLMPFILVVHSGIPIVIKYSIDSGIVSRNQNVIVLGSSVFLGLVILEYLLRSSQTMLLAVAVHRMIRCLRLTLIQHTLNLPLSYHDKTLSGALVTRATSDFDNMSESLNQAVISSIIDLAIIVGTISGMLFLNWKLALSVISVLPFVYLTVGWFSKSLKKAMLKSRVKISRLNAYTQECLYGLSTIKVLVAEKSASENVHKYAKSYRNAQMQTVTLDAFMFAILDGIASISIGVFLWFAVDRGGFAGGSLTEGVIIAFVAYIVRLYDPLKQLGQKIAMMQGAFTSMDRVFGILEVDGETEGKNRIKKIVGSVEFINVSFSYDKQSLASILSEVSFSVEAGKSLAIVGPTGSGKSTVVKLLAKLYEGYSGQILLDGLSLSDLDSVSLRQKIATVPQDITLFSGSIEFNISLGLAGISRKDVEAAAKIVGIDDFIKNLPGGYDFKLAAKGSNLSQGQRQLIAFARAIVKKPSLVILDEATSSVDPKSESNIQKAIKLLLAERTVIVIAHRLETIRNCDEIIVISEGKVMERGTHRSLLAYGGIYSRMQSSLG